MHGEEMGGVQMATTPKAQDQLRKNKMMSIVDALSLRNSETPSIKAVATPVSSWAAAYSLR